MPTPKGDHDGLLSRVVKFVRSSTSSAGEADVSEGGPDSGYSRQMLKEMIERKRRNDFVRKREFDMLRKLRRAEPAPPPGATARPSFFQSSMPSRPDDRASTLKKIDEIEAQMSQQWWKTRGGTEVTRHGGFDPTGTMTLGGFDSPTLPPSQADVGAAMSALARTLPAALPAMELVPPTLSPGDSLLDDSPSTSFSASKQSAVDVAEFAHDPAIEEAAIRFANGDDAGAEAALRLLLAPGAAREQHEETWLVLFDLYRAIGEKARFEEAAIAFATRFGRSAPQWQSLDAATPAGEAGEAVATAGEAFLWTCPASLGPSQVSALAALAARSPAPWRLDWSRLSAIEPGAAMPLQQLFAQWASQPVRLVFGGAEALARQLAGATPSGDAGQDPAWWRLRMDGLRLMGRADEFELAALDYCVTYEVSPPAWERPRAQVESLGPGGGPAFSSTVTEAWRDSTPRSMAAASGFGAPHGELAGAVQGDAAGALAALDDPRAGPGPLVVCCARLARVDFAAAGTLLNWAIARGAEGRPVHFTEVHRLVAALFNVIGLGAQARVSLRRD
ncbi:STAS domain-containing protein [Ramlibacter sp. MAHUQ-53]|uniref:STAS domain-containing protein n=1 Tax=unclassified Ramlibacter TaxID=2617605 RepID=UPI0036414A0F